VDRLYKFSINTRQHQTLETKLAASYSSAVFYVLPLFVKWTKVNSYVPRLARDTWLLPIKDVSSKAHGLWKECHTLEIDKATIPPRASVFSPQLDTSLINAEDAFHAAGDMFPLQGLIPSGSLVDWVRSVSRDFSVAQDLPNRFRGLHSIFVPAQG
jgi:hypothetical protein